MIYGVYSIYDKVAQIFSLPWYEVNNDVAKRRFSDSCKLDNIVSAHPSDYELYHVGNFDVTSGKFIFEKPLLILAGNSVVGDNDV